MKFHQKTPIYSLSNNIKQLLFVSTITYASNVAGNDDSMWDMSLVELGQIQIVSIATGTDTPLDKAAAVATVITKQDIAAIGATDLDDILETVPGLHIGRSDQGYTEKYNFRGITSAFNPQALMLINGIPITNLAFGNRGNVWAGMPIQSIAKIEVIRGPGSAMHGADAFAGVINVITKTSDDISGTTAGFRVGSFNTRATWLETSHNHNNFDIAFTLEYETTDGQSEPIEADAFGYSGNISNMIDTIESRLTIEHNNSRLRLGFQDRSNIGTGVGVLPLLDPTGRFASRRINGDYTYTKNDILPDLNVEARLSYYSNTQEVEENIILAPPFAFGPGFPEGFIGNPGFEEENARVDISSLYRGLDKHIIRAGTGFFWGDVFKTTETKNFNPDNSPRAGGLEDVSDTAEIWLPETDRTSYHVFIQDEWQLLDNWQLTSGVRYDHYSDFGDTINPRLALVWATTDTITTKMLYGRAFRAPSISDLFVTSNPVNLGNPDLEPETIDSLEFVFSHTMSPSLNYTTNAFYYQIQDFITLVPIGSIKQSQNSNDRTGYGVEIEIDYEPINNLRLLSNYAYQKSEDDESKKNVGDAPNQQLYFRAEWHKENWILSSQLNWVGEQKRVPEDTLRTESVDDYTTVDLTIRRLSINNKLNVSLSVRNIFDEDVIEPSPISPIGGIPSDFPMPGRNLYSAISYEL